MQEESKRKIPTYIWNYTKIMDVKAIWNELITQRLIQIFILEKTT